MTISAPIHERISSGSFGCVSLPMSRFTRLVMRRKSAIPTAASTIAPNASWLAT